MKQRTQNGPVPGSSRVYRCVPVDSADAFETAARYFRARGWTVLETDYVVALNTQGTWLTVVLWAVAPKREEATA